MKQLLEVARCPITHESFSELTADELAEVNSRIAAGKLRNRTDEHVEIEWVQGLVNESRTWVFPVYGHGAALIANEAVSACQLLASVDEPTRLTDENNG